MDLIDVEPMKPGWGQIWQSGLEEMILKTKVRVPRMIVSMCGAGVDFTRDPVLSVFIEDQPDDVLIPTVLFSMVDSVIAFLSQGTNVIIHCFQGKSRSSYLNCAVHMRAMNISYDEALALIRKQHPIAHPNIGFELQLRRLESALRGTP